MSLLTPEHVATYLRDGIVVIENVISDEQVEKIRDELHRDLLKYGIDHDALLSGTVEAPEGARIKSDASNIFYGRYKLDLHLSEPIYRAYLDLMTHTYLSGDVPGFEHPFGRCTDVLPYIDRICYRLPDHIRAEGGLKLHIDRDPTKYCSKKFRPIQGFVTLTDHYGSQSGGLKVVKGFHRVFESYFGKTTDELCPGDFFRMHGHEHAKIQRDCEPINAPRGSLIMWDNRLPHETCEKLESFDTREVVYLSYLPNTKINIGYHERQRENFVANMLPPSCAAPDKGDRDYEISELNDWEKKLLGL